MNKPAWASLAMMQNLQKIGYLGFLVVVLALIPWMASDYVSSLAATQATAHTTLRMLDEKDDARMTRAFEFARRNNRIEATLVMQRQPDPQTRDALLTVTAGSKREALDGMAATIEAMQKAFAQDGERGELYDEGNRPRALPVPNANSILIRRACNLGALLILLGGLTLMVKRLLRSGLPPAAMIAIVVLLCVGASLLVAGPIAWIVALPFLLIGMGVIFTRRVRRAAKWEEAQAKITTSKITVKRHQFTGEQTKITNQATVGYDFSVGSKLFHGNRISLGFGPSDGVTQTLKRYPVGATVPVFYDPENPAESVLERKPPTSLGCIWGGTIVAVLVYVGVLLFIGKSEILVDRISAAFQTALPRIHHPVVMVASGLFGLLCLGSWLWNRRHVREAIPSLVTKGRIVSINSKSKGDRRSAEAACDTSLTEFAYTVDGQEYHNSIGDLDTMPAAAQAEVARYVVGTEVNVHYDPNNPLSSALEIDKDVVLDGRTSFVVGLVCLALAIYLALP